jgi:hypothetical protein
MLILQYVEPEEIKYSSNIITVLTLKRETINMKTQCVTEGSLHGAGSRTSWHSAIITIMNLSPRGAHINRIL